MAEFVKIPKDRVGVLVGKEGKTKFMIEKKSKIKLDIDREGGVSISSPEEDGLAEWKAVDTIKAIGRGFNPKYAVNLLKEDYVLSVINLFDIFKQRDSDVRRIKARVIGEGGKAWKTLELLSNTKLSVYGRTISIIGSEEDVALAEKAIQMIINGSSHPTVYNFLERERGGRRIGL